MQVISNCSLRHLFPVMAWYMYDSGNVKFEEDPSSAVPSSSTDSVPPVQTRRPIRRVISTRKELLALALALHPAFEVCRGLRASGRPMKCSGAEPEQGRCLAPQGGRTPRDVLSVRRPRRGAGGILPTVSELWRYLTNGSGGRCMAVVRYVPLHHHCFCLISGLPTGIFVSRSCDRKVSMAL